jgi:hypothetical protein
MDQRLLRLHMLRTALALALVAGFLATPAGLAHVGLPGHDPCDALLLGQDPGTPGLTPSAGLNGHGHCFTCHWFQSLRSALVAQGVVIAATCTVGPFTPDARCSVEANASLPTAARAPPA